ncbi:MAG: hypothetical protein NUW37_06890 [Planctomycetes bacterium]|nr:hypothetical protein [Planctomycetota bacterium]
MKKKRPKYKFKIFTLCFLFMALTAVWFASTIKSKKSDIYRAKRNNHTFIHFDNISKSNKSSSFQKWTDVEYVSANIYRLTSERHSEYRDDEIDTIVHGPLADIILSDRFSAIDWYSLMGDSYMPLFFRMVQVIAIGGNPSVHSQFIDYLSRYDYRETWHRPYILDDCQSDDICNCRFCHGRLRKARIFDFATAVKELFALFPSEKIEEARLEAVATNNMDHWNEAIGRLFAVFRKEFPETVGDWITDRRAYLRSWNNSGYDSFWRSKGNQ